MTAPSAAPLSEGRLRIGVLFGWPTDALTDTHVAAILEHYDRLERQLAEARANARTPGTVEVCDRYLSGNTCGAYDSYGREFDDCHHDNCPIKRAAQEAGK